MEVSRLRITALAGVLLLVGLAVGTGLVVGQQAPAPAGLAPGDAVARVADRSLTLEELDETALSIDAGSFQGMKLSQALYEARRQAVEAWIADQLVEREADSRGLGKEALVDAEVRSKVTEVTDADIEAWYEANPGRVQQAPLEQVREPIQNLLEQQRFQVASRDFIDSLRQTVDVTINLEPPRLEIQIAANDPSYGPEDAPIQMVEFSDFQ